MEVEYGLKFFWSSMRHSIAATYIIIIIKMVLFYLFIQYYAVLKKISKTFNIYTSCPEMVTGEKPPDKSPPVKS